MVFTASENQKMNQDKPEQGTVLPDAKKSLFECVEKASLKRTGGAARPVSGSFYGAESRAREKNNSKLAVGRKAEGTPTGFHKRLHH